MEDPKSHCDEYEKRIKELEEELDGLKRYFGEDKYEQNLEDGDFGSALEVIEKCDLGDKVEELYEEAMSRGSHMDALDAAKKHDLGFEKKRKAAEMLLEGDATDAKSKDEYEQRFDEIVDNHSLDEILDDEEIQEKKERKKRKLIGKASLKYRDSDLRKKYEIAKKWFSEEKEKEAAENLLKDQVEHADWAKEYKRLAKMAVGDYGLGTDAVEYICEEMTSEIKTGYGSTYPSEALKIARKYGLDAKFEEIYREMVSDNPSRAWKHVDGSELSESLAEETFDKAFESFKLTTALSVADACGLDRDKANKAARQLYKTRMSNSNFDGAIEVAEKYDLGDSLIKNAKGAKEGIEEA